MHTSRTRRGLASLLGVLAVTALTLTSAAPTGAQEEPAPPPVFEGGYDLVPLPGYEEYDGCPLLNAGQYRFCVALTVNGDLELGDVGGTIDDLRLVMAVAGGLSGEPTIVPAPGDSAPAAVPVSGGILGIPGLDPILELDPLQLLSLSATPEMGELSQTGLDQIITFGVLGFLGYPTFPTGDELPPLEEPVPLPPAGEPFCVDFFGTPNCLGPYPEVGIGLPLTLKLNNLLLGDDCAIGPIDLALTSGTTTPPEGVEPLTGSSGDLAKRQTEPIDFHVDGMRFVGNDFAVPGADCGGVLQTGRLLRRLGLGNPFDTLVNKSAGLPSPAGASQAELTVDLHVAEQDAVYGPAMGFSTDAIDFGEVAVGDASEPQTLTITNRRNGPRRVYSQVFVGGADFVATENGCNDVELASGESCEMTIVFSPTRAGVHERDVRVNAYPDTDRMEVPLTGRGI